MSDTVTKSKNVTESRECGDAVTTSPRPWRLEPMFNGVADARGEKVAANIRAADAALIVEAVNEYSPIPKTEMLADAVSDNIALMNERDRLRDIVRQMADTLEHVSNEHRFDFYELVREARAAIGEDKP